MIPDGINNLVRVLIEDKSRREDLTNDQCI